MRKSYIVSIFSSKEFELISWTPILLRLRGELGAGQFCIALKIKCFINCNFLNTKNKKYCSDSLLIIFM